MLKCECGFEARAADEEALAAAVRRHALDAHGIAFSPEEALLLAARVASTRPQTSTQADEEER